MNEGLEVRPGEILSGKYVVERMLGQGGMGVVVLARHLQIDQLVAIKIIRPEAAQNPENVSRLLREARAAARLHSEHVVRVLDVGTSPSGLPFIVMEYLQGQDLAKVLEQGPVPLAAAVDFIIQACDAVAEAHALGIVHRDLKPGNLFLAATTHGRQLLKVVDFGIAKMETITDRAITRTSAIMGSPAYMSPEQLRSSHNVDNRSDIWSLGVILWHLVTGYTPFNADTFTELCIRITVDPVPPWPKLPGVPAAFGRALLGALQKEPERRYQTIAELARALAPFCSDAMRDLAERIGAGAEVAVAPPADGSGHGTSTIETAAGQRMTARQPQPRWSLLAGGLFIVLAAAVGIVLAVLRTTDGEGRDAGAPAVRPPIVADAATAVILPPLPDAAATVPDAAPPSPPDAAPPSPPDAEVGEPDAAPAVVAPPRHKPKHPTRPLKPTPPKPKQPFDPFRSPD